MIATKSKTGTAAKAAPAATNSNDSVIQIVTASVTTLEGKIESLTHDSVTIVYKRSRSKNFEKRTFLFGKGTNLISVTGEQGRHGSVTFKEGNGSVYRTFKNAVISDSNANGFIEFEFIDRDGNNIKARVASDVAVATTAVPFTEELVKEVARPTRAERVAGSTKKATSAGAAQAPVVSKKTARPAVVATAH